MSKSFNLIRRSRCTESGGRDHGRGGRSEDLAAEEGGRASGPQLQTQRGHPQRTLERHLRQVGIYVELETKVHASEGS